jgi:hypothetical protein
MHFSDRSCVSGKTNYVVNLPMIHFILFNAATRFDHLKPAQMINSLMRPFYGHSHSHLNELGECAGLLDKFINRVFHIWIMGLYLLGAVGLTVKFWGYHLRT